MLGLSGGQSLIGYLSRGIACKVQCETLVMKSRHLASSSSLFVASEAKNDSVACSDLVDRKGRNRAGSTSSLFSIEVDHLRKMPLVDLVKLRPKQPYSAEGERYSTLFSLHPTVAAIDMHQQSPNDIAQAWSTLRTQQKTTPGILSKLTRSIDHYMKCLASKEVQQRVAAIWLDANRSDHINRDQSRRLPYAQLDPKSKVEQNRRNAENQKRLKLSFQHYLDKHHVMIREDSNASQIEEQTRFFQQEIMPRESSATKLGIFLRGKGYDEVDIQAAMASRRLFMKREGYRKQFYKRREVSS